MRALYSVLAFFAVLAFTPGSLCQEESSRPIDLQEAINTAVERNIGVELQRINVESSRIQFDKTRAVYEVDVTSTVSTNSNDRRPNNIQEGPIDSTITETRDAWTTTVSKREDFGLSYQVDFNNFNLDSNAQNSFGGIWQSSINLSATQELLRGYAFDEEVVRRDEFVALRNVDVAREDLEISISSIIEQTENAYWDLVAAIQNLNVANQSLELAQQLYEQNKIKIEVGTLAPIELVNTEATVASREKDIVDAENLVRAAEDRLKKVMNLPMGEWDTRLTPAVNIEIREFTANAQADYERALRSRPEVRKQELERQKALLNLKYNRNQKLPGLQVQTNYNTRGTDFTDASMQAATFTDAVDEALGNEFPNWTLALQVNWKPWNKAAKIGVVESNVALRQAELNFAQARVDIMEEVRTAARDVRAYYEAVKASEKTLSFREQNLKAEEQKFQNGLSDNYRVAEVQEELARARADLNQAKVNYQKSLVSYYKSIGELPNRRNISIE